MAEGNEKKDYYWAVSALQQGQRTVEDDVTGDGLGGGVPLDDLGPLGTGVEGEVTEQELLNEIDDGASDAENDSFWEALGENRLESGACIDDGENDWVDTSRGSEPIELYSENFLGDGSGSGKISRIGEYEWHDTSGDEDGRFSGIRDELSSEAELGVKGFPGASGNANDNAATAGATREYVSIPIEDEKILVVPDTANDDCDNSYSVPGSPPFVDDRVEIGASPSAVSHDDIVDVVPTDNTGGQMQSQEQCNDPVISAGGGGMESGVEASTETFFKQGFLRSFKEHSSPPKKSRQRPQSVPINSNNVGVKEPVISGNVWDKVVQWARRRRSKRPSLRGIIQGRGGPLVIPGRRDTSLPQVPSGTNPTMLQAYVNFMYYICVSTRKIDNGQPTIKKAAGILQKIGFWTLAILSILYSINLLKYHSMEFMNDGEFHDYIHLGFLIVYGITRLYSLVLHAFNSGKIKEMVTCMNDATLGATDSRYISYLAYALGVSSVVLAAAGSLFGSLPLKDMTLEGIVLTRAYKMSHTIFVWSVTNYQNATDMLDNSLPQEINWTTAALATFQIMLTFCGNLQDFILGDLIFSSAISLYSNTKRYVADIKKLPVQNVTYADFARKWNEYQLIAQASDTFYETCGTLLTLYHIYNILEFAVFLRFMLFKRAAHFLFITTAVNVIKCMVTYVIAVRISEKNQECRNWVRHCAFNSLTRKKQKHRKLYMQAILMLDEMKENPLGFGRDELFIDKGFFITFLGAVASLFVVLVEGLANEKCP